MADLISKTKSGETHKKKFDSDVLADFSVILGDMNYRLDTGYTQFINEVHTASQRLPELDQLYKVMHDDLSKRCYVGYEEGVIGFLPTYKRGRQENSYVNKKNQSPSYTDRILIKNNTTHETEMKKYDVLDNVFGSDHRPVVCELIINLKQTRYVDEPMLLDDTKAGDQVFCIFVFDNITLNHFEPLSE